MSDEDAARRAEDARLALEARFGDLIATRAKSEREAFWDRLGVNVRTDEGIEHFAKVLAWNFRAQERSATLGRRTLGWITFVITLGGFLFEAIRFYVELRGHG